MKLLALIVLALLIFPAYALAVTQTPTVSYNFGRASRYHAPISDYGLLAIDHAAPELASLAANSSRDLTGSFSVKSIRQNALRFINDSSYMPQSETSLAVDPNNSSHLVGGFNDGRWFFCPLLPKTDCPTGYTQSLSGFAISADGGKSLFKGNDIPGVSATELDPSNHSMIPGTLTAHGDPSVTAGVDGSFFYGSLAIDTATSANGIMLAVSNSGLWSRSVSCVTPLSSPTSNPCWKTILVYGNLTKSPASFEDRGLLSVDRNPQSPFFGSVYVGWDHFNSNGTSNSFLARCAKDLSGCTMLAGGKLPPISRSDPYTSFTTPVVAKDGTVFVTWCNYGTATAYGPVTCKVRPLTTGSSGFGPTTTVLSFMGNNTALPDETVVLGYATEQYRVASSPNMAVDASGKTNNLYFSIETCSSSPHFYVFLPSKLAFPLPTDNPGNCGQSQVLFSSSTNGGVTWSAPVDVSASASVNSQPYVTVDQSNGDVYVLFYTTQFDAFNHRLDVVAQRSTDGGSSFNEIRVTSVSNEPDSDPAMYDYVTPAGFGGSFIVPQFGDYFQAIALGGKLWVLFTADYAAMRGTFQSDPFLVSGTPSSFSTALSLLIQTETPVFAGQAVHIVAIAQWSNGTLATARFPVAQLVDPAGNVAQLNSPSLLQRGVYSWTVKLPPNSPDGSYVVFLRANSTGAMAQGTGSFTVNSQLATAPAVASLQNSLSSFETSISGSLAKMQSSLNIMNSTLRAILDQASTGNAIATQSVLPVLSVLRAYQYYALAVGILTTVLVAVAIVILLRRR